jgi:hypothetical protein
VNHPKLTPQELNQVLADLRPMVGTLGVRGAAAKLNLSPAYVCRVLAGLDPPGPAIWRQLGYAISKVTVQ